jgi:hypothetical protein
LIEKENKVINIERVAGVVANDEVARFRKLIFRATKGKSFMFTEPYVDKDDPKLSKSVYIITYYDGQHTRDRIYKICDSFSGQRYSLPETNVL